ncbi:MAG: 16S rRNA (uracil(1498)-N(3))-methyltransferase [Gammaproteobacteria bacterium]|nr:16S rRNA (uracil(1498)-N(3))-methyltransferase [Gammaproteobacteria bacterium]
MNIVLIHPSDFLSPSTVVLRDHRAQHLKQVVKVTVGDTVRVGLINELMGEGIVQSTGDELILEVNICDAPPAPLPLTLLLAMPRPKMLKRTLQSVVAMGVKEIYLINSYRVEKSFWQSPVLSDQGLLEQSYLGLEQARDTVLPNIYLRKRFKPFVEDELPEIIQGTQAIVAHPIAEQSIPTPLNQPCTLAVGPEGGFIPYEVDKLNEAGFTSMHMGSRILRVETAVPALLASLYSF